MTTLNNIYNKRNQIAQLAQQLGFRQLAIHDTDSVDDASPLFLLVDVDRQSKDASSAKMPLLRQQLEQLLHCQVVVLLRETLDELTKTHMLEKSCLLENEAGLKALFTIDYLEEMTFSPLTEREETRKHHPSPVAQAGLMGPPPAKKTKTAPPSPEEIQRTIQRLEKEQETVKAWQQTATHASVKWSECLQHLQRAAESAKAASAGLAPTTSSAKPSPTNISVR